MSLGERARVVRPWHWLKVGFQRTGDRFTSVTLTGPADLVFTGDIEL